MPSSYTANYLFEKPYQGEQANTWGLTLNKNFDSIDTHIFTNQTNITNQGTDVTNLKNEMSSTGNAGVPPGIFTSGLQTQITANYNAINAASSGLLPRMAVVESAVLYLQQQLAQQQPSALNNALVALTTRVSTAEGNITTLQGQMGTANSNIATLTGRVNTLASLQPQAQFRTQNTNSGSVTGDWVILKELPTDGSANAIEIAFGRGTGQEGDAIVLPTGFSSANCYAEAAIYSIGGGGTIANIVVAMSGITITSCHATVGGTQQGRGTCVASWMAHAWRTGVT